MKALSAAKNLKQHLIKLCTVQDLTQKFVAGVHRNLCDKGIHALLADTCIQELRKQSEVQLHLSSQQTVCEY